MNKEAGTYSSVLGLRDEEVYYDGLNGAPAGEDDVGVPSNLLHGYRPGELVEHLSWNMLADFTWRTAYAEGQDKAYQ